MSLSFWRRTNVLLLILACMAVASFAIWQFFITARYGTYTTLASMIEKGEAVSAAAVSDYAARADALPATCRSDLLGAVITVSMQNVEQMRSVGDQVGWVASLRAMEPRLHRALACVPTDGMLWERLAVVRWFLGGSAQEQARLLTLSQAYAPGELDVVRARMVQWTRVTPAVVDLAQDALGSDIRVTFGHSSAEAVEVMMRDMPASLQPLLKAAAADLPPDRAADLAKAGVSLP